jgi:hypothetical protein
VVGLLAAGLLARLPQCRQRQGVLEQPHFVRNPGLAFWRKIFGQLTKRVMAAHVRRPC